MQTLSEWRTEERADGTWFVVNLAELGFRIEDNGTTSGAFLAVCAPRGIVGGLPALAKGDPGFPISLVLSSFVELAEDDPTPASASINILTPATDVSGPWPTYGVAGPVIGGVIVHLLGDTVPVESRRAEAVAPVSYIVIGGWAVWPLLVTIPQHLT